MKKKPAPISLLAALAAIALCAPTARAADLADPDTQAVRAYALTDAAFTKYVQATRALAGVRLADCDDDEEDDVTSLAEAAAKIDAVPAAKAALQGAGLTSREYVLIAFALVDANFASYALQTPGGKLPAGVAMANVDFVRRHTDALRELGNETDDNSCEEGTDE
jgi:hypothetical protein